MGFGCVLWYRYWYAAVYSSSHVTFNWSGPFKYPLARFRSIIEFVHTHPHAQPTSTASVYSAAATHLTPESSQPQSHRSESISTATAGQRPATPVMLSTTSNIHARPSSTHNTGGDGGGGSRPLPSTQPIRTSTRQHLDF